MHTGSLVYEGEGHPRNLGLSDVQNQTEVFKLFRVFALKVFGVVSSPTAVEDPAEDSAKPDAGPQPASVEVGRASRELSVANHAPLPPAWL